MCWTWMSEKRRCVCNLYVPAVPMACCAPAMNPWIGPNDSPSDGDGMLRKFGISGSFGNCGSWGNDGKPTGNATGTGKMIGDFFKFFKMIAALAILATFNALNAFNAANFNANFFLKIRTGAVNALIAASFFAFN